MPLSPRPLHPSEHPNADEAPSGFREWSQHAGAPAPVRDRAPVTQPALPGIDLTHPLAKVVAVAFVGYTFGRLVHRRSRKIPQAPQPRPRAAPEPMTTYRSRPAEDQRSSIRFR